MVACSYQITLLVFNVESHSYFYACPVITLYISLLFNYSVTNSTGATNVFRGAFQ